VLKTEGFQLERVNRREIVAFLINHRFFFSGKKRPPKAHRASRGRAQRSGATVESVGARAIAPLRDSKHAALMRDDTWRGTFGHYAPRWRARKQLGQLSVWLLCRGHSFDTSAPNRDGIFVCRIRPWPQKM